MMWDQGHHCSSLGKSMVKTRMLVSNKDCCDFSDVFIWVHQIHSGGADSPFLTMSLHFLLLHSFSVTSQMFPWPIIKHLVLQRQNFLLPMANLHLKSADCSAPLVLVTFSRSAACKLCLTCIRAGGRGQWPLPPGHLSMASPSPLCFEGTRSQSRQHGWCASHPSKSTDSAFHPIVKERVFLLFFFLPTRSYKWVFGLHNGWAAAKPCHMFQLIHVGFASHPRKKKKGHLWVGIQQDHVGRKGWGSDAIFVAVIIWWPDPWPLTSALEGLFNWPVVMERRRTGWEVQADEEQLFAAWTHPQADPLPPLVITSSWPRNKNVNTLLLIHWLETKASREVRALPSYDPLLLKSTGQGLISASPVLRQRNSMALSWVTLGSRRFIQTQPGLSPDYTHGNVPCTEYRGSYSSGTNPVTMTNS